MNDLQRAARQLHACGFATLPIKPGEKVPATAHGVKDATRDDAATDAYFEHKVGHGVGISGEGFVIFDLDCHGEVDGRETLLDWEREHGHLPETLRQTTPSGGEHIIYRSADEVRPSVNSALAVDVRAWGSYVVCDPTPGYTWEQDLTADAIADVDAQVLAFLDYVRPAKKSTAVGGAQGIAEGGRNDYIFREGCSAHAKGVGGAELLAYLEAKNRLECNPPLPTSEVEKIAASVDALPAGYSPEVKAQQARKGMPAHVIYGDRLIKELHACMVDETPAVLSDDGKSYRMGWDAITRAHIAMHRVAKMAEQREVRNFIRFQAPPGRVSDPHLIAFTNGILDVRTMELRAFTPADVIPNVIPHRWNPDAQSTDVDRVLARISAGDPTVEMNLCEFAGLCMYRDSAKYGYMAILLGRNGANASNGKSTYIDMLAHMLGGENYCTLDMAIIGERFQAGNLVGKLANLGDDISNERLHGGIMATVKKAVTGQELYTDVKGGAGFKFRPYATMVFSANTMPSLEDSTEGVTRRLFPIRFNARFMPSDADFDPDIMDKLRTETAAERLIVRAIGGLRRVLENRRPTPNAESVRMVQDIRLDNSSVLQWIEYEGITADWCVGKTPTLVHEEYDRWCTSNGFRQPKATSSMSKELMGELGLETVQVKIDGKNYRQYIPQGGLNERFNR